MAARAFVEWEGCLRLRAVCRETGIAGVFVDAAVDSGYSERRALAALCDACDCDDYHSVMEGDASTVSDEPQKLSQTMPDKTKLDALDKAGFKIKATCGICVHATIRVGSDWGTCSLIRYEHEKHTGSPRDASIHKAGGCALFELDPADKTDLAKSGFDRFV